MAQVVALTDELLESDDTPKLLALRLHVVRATSLRMMGRMAEARATLDAAVACAEAADASPTSDTLLDLNEAAAGLPEDHQLKTGFEVDKGLEEANLLEWRVRTSRQSAFSRTHSPCVRQPEHRYCSKDAARLGLVAVEHEQRNSRARHPEKPERRTRLRAKKGRGDFSERICVRSLQHRQD